MRRGTRNYGWPPEVTIEVIRKAADRFAAKTQRAQDSDCVLWTGCKNKHGYGSVSLGGRKAGRPSGAHRVAFAMHHGRLPSGDVLHRCNIPACVNPEHLYEGTQFDNIRQCVRDGRHARAGGGNHGERHGVARLTEAAVLDIRRRYAEHSSTPTQLAREYEVAVQTVWHVLYRRTWTHI